MTPAMHRNALRGILARTAASGVSGRPEAEIATVVDGLAFLLAQIEATVLARRLYFDLPGGSRLECDVSGARLQGCSLHDGAREETVALAESDAAASGELASLLRRAFAMPGHVRMRTGPAETDGDAPGMAGPELRALLKLEAATGDGEETPDLVSFLNEVEPHLICACLLDGDEMQVVSGEDGDLITLSDALPPVAGTPDCPEDPFARLLGPEGVLLLGGDGADSAAILLVVHGGMTGAAFVRPGAEHEVMRLWAEFTK
ncbi:MAG: hypothetical protein ACU0DK_11460 [Pseudooceanicola sp.]